MFLPGTLFGPDQVPHDRAAGNCQLTHEMPAVGQGAGAPALANQLQNALPPVILGTGRDFTSDTGIEIAAKRRTRRSAAKPQPRPNWA